MRALWRGGDMKLTHTPSDAGNKGAIKKRLPTPPANGHQILSEFNAGGKFTTTVPLPDMVAILVEVWENEEL